MVEEPVADIQRLYRDRFSATEQAAKEQVWRVLCEEFFSQFVRPTDTVVDIACGYGEFINFIPCANRIALDVNPEVREHLRPEVVFHHQSCEDLSCLGNASVDVVFESNLFEHLPSKLALTQLVRTVYRKLRSGGRFIIMQPNIKYVGADYWDFYDHLIPLSHLSCVELLRNCQFQIVRVVPRFVPYTTKSRIPKHPLLVKAFLRCPILWRLLGKQFVIVARKEGSSASSAIRPLVGAHG